MTTAIGCAYHETRKKDKKDWAVETLQKSQWRGWKRPDSASLQVQMDHRRFFLRQEGDTASTLGR